MNRREYLSRTAAVLGAGVLAGCVGSNVPNTDGTETDVPAPGDETSVARQSFEVVNGGCGNEVNEASVAFEDASVRVTGTITGNDACKTAKLAAAEFRDGAFHVVVETADEKGAGACAECLTEIDYEATFGFDGGLPGKVVVEHRSLGKRRTVATAAD